MLVLILYEHDEQLCNNYAFQLHCSIYDFYCCIIIKLFCNSIEITDNLSGNLIRNDGCRSSVMNAIRAQNIENCIVKHVYFSIKINF